MSDWQVCELVSRVETQWNARFGTYGVDQPLNAGLDLEMPGPPRWRTPVLVNHCLTSQKLHTATLDERVMNLLKFVQHQAKLNPDVVFGDGQERTRDNPEIRQFCRKIAAEGIVLLKNIGDLPLSPRSVKSLAVIGSNSRESIISGGGSAALRPSYAVTPLDGIEEGAYEGLKIDHEVGCYGERVYPLPGSH
jgi:beta-glucosidase